MWGHWCPCFRLLVTSPGFQSQSGQPYSCLTEAYVLHIPWDSSLVWHLPNLLAASMAAKPVFSIYLLTGIGGAQNWDLSCHRGMLYVLSYNLIKCLNQSNILIAVLIKVYCNFKFGQNFVNYCKLITCFFRAKIIDFKHFELTVSII